MSDCLITGASSGIGEALAFVYARHGHALWLLGRDVAALNRVKTQIQAKYDVKVVLKSQDLTRPHAIDDVMAWLDQSQACIQHLVNNAGCGHVGPFIDMSRAHHLTVIDLNIRAVVDLTHRLLPNLKSANVATILNISSMGAVLPGPYVAVYYASKAFVHSWSEALAHEMQNQNVQVTTCAPGPVSTQFGKRAGFKLSGRQRMIALDAKTVAEEAYTATMSGRRFCYPGRWMKGFKCLLPMIPRKYLMRAMAYVLQERLHQSEASD